MKSEPWSVFNLLRSPVNEVHHVRTNARQILSTVCLYYLPLKSKNLALKKWVAVPTICRLALPSKNMKTIANSSEILSLLEFGRDTLNLIAVWENFWPVPETFLYLFKGTLGFNASFPCSCQFQQIKQFIRCRLRKCLSNFTSSARMYNILLSLS